MRRLLGVLVLSAFLGNAGAADKELPVVFRADLTKDLSQWDMTDAKAWKIAEVDGARVLSQFAQSKYTPTHRSPLNMALVKGVIVGDFILDAKVQSTGKDGPHRDMCLFFGHQDPTHFYYVHIAKKTDDHANQIFIVDNKPREKISTKTTEGTPWDDKWHHVRIVRTVADGKIEIYFDDLNKPIMTATDRTFLKGRIGLGSFDDTGNWKDIVLRGVKIETK